MANVVPLYNKDSKNNKNKNNKHSNNRPETISGGKVVGGVS